MEETRKLKLASIKRQIEQGKYVVDERAVAEAIIRRVRELALAGGPFRMSLS